MNGLLMYTERPYAKILLKNNTTLYVKVGSVCEIRKNRMQYFAKCLNPLFFFIMVKRQHKKC